MFLTMLNGPCGVGKSETAKTIEKQYPETVKWVRLDDVRKTIPEEHFMKDGRPDAMALMWHANVIGRKIARSALEHGANVIVDAIKYQPEWVEPWEQLGKETHATVLDMCLMASKALVMERAAARGYKTGGRLTPEKVSRLYDQVIAFCVERPDTIVIANDQLSIEETADVVAGHMQLPPQMGQNNA